MITETQFNMLDKLFDYYNQKLFGGKLNDCMINMSRQKGAYGFFQPQNWKKYNLKKESNKDIHEISLNPNYLDRPDIEWHSTLVHEMAHLWQQDFGKPSRSNYHNKEWARKMEEIGLIPSSTGQPGGKKTGQSMTHYVAPDGQFIEAFNRLMEKNIKYSPLQGPETNKTVNRKAYKTKYECLCGNNVWGKPGLHIVCAVCNQNFKQTE
jgi:predicted SprT family Zn-dependent metalloprotease